MGYKDESNYNNLNHNDALIIVQNIQSKILIKECICGEYVSIFFKILCMVSYRS